MENETKIINFFEKKKKQKIETKQKLMLIRVHNVALGARGEGFSVRLSWIDFEFLVRRWLFLFEWKTITSRERRQRSSRRKGKKREKGCVEKH